MNKDKDKVNSYGNTSSVYDRLKLSGLIELYDKYSSYTDHLTVDKFVKEFYTISMTEEDVKYLKRRYEKTIIL